MTLRLGIDPTTQEFAAELHLRGAPGTTLASNLLSLSPGPSRFGGVIAGNPALAALVHLQLSNDYPRLLASLSRQAAAQIARDEGSNFGKEHGQFVELIGKAMEIGELDVALATRSHGRGKPGSLFELKVPDGEALDKLFRDLAAKEWPDEDRSRLKFNADDLPSDKGARIHRYETAAQAQKVPSFSPMLANGPNLISFSKDALWMTSGTNGRDAIQAALQDPSRPAPIFHFELNMKALAEPVSVFSPGAARLDDVQVALTDEHPGRLHLSLDGGAHLRLRASLDLALFRLATRLVNIQWQFEERPAQR